jgi:hypothetical protein
MAVFWASLILLDRGEFPDFILLTVQLIPLVIDDLLLCITEIGASRIKQFRRIATRYDKLDRSYLAFLGLVCTFVWLL